ncbi:hypothetical protein ACQPZJ_22730 [Actinoplanes sp. CA-054009]
MTLDAVTIDDKTPRRAGADRSRDIVPKIIQMFNELTEIKVVTVVGKVQVELEESDGRTATKVTTPEPPTEALVTIFDLTDGDVTNVISPELRDDEALRSYHLQQVDRSIQVLPAHFKTLIDAAETIINHKW